MSTHRDAGQGRVLVSEEVAVLLRCSLRTVHELACKRDVPHFKLLGSRRCLFQREELEAWESGADLDVLELRHGGRVVRTLAVPLVARPQGQS